MIIAIVVLVFARETEPFMDKRIAFLQIPVEVRRKEKGSAVKEKVGIIAVFNILSGIISDKVGRKPVVGAFAFVIVLSTLIGLVISSVCVGIFDVGIFTAIFAIPFVVFGTILVIAGVKETKGINLNSIE